MIRLFVKQDLSDGARLVLDPDQSRYLATVMRLAAGDELLVFNGRDGEWRARVAAVGKKSVELEAVSRSRPQATGPDLELVIALVKRARLETIVEKAAELGCARVRLAITERTQSDHTRLDRLQAIAVEAAEQTGRLDVPAIAAPEKLETLLAGWDRDRRLLFCDEAGDAPNILEVLCRGSAPSTASRSPSPAVAGEVSSRADAADERTSPMPAGDGGGGPRSGGGGAATATGPWAILIGPEGGFSPKERETLRDKPFTTACSLGPRILRADTAAIAALSVWQAALGDWTP
jgi:16S rRNA (uracil1498-N3)-methyltransferase